ncbi:MAG: 5'-methylthioadenosine/S-adenosylhomocysteine nucleosidase [Bacilli bacterium]
MKIAIVGAMDCEIEFLNSKMHNVNQKVVEGFTFFIGYINNINIIVVKSGIGKVAAGILFTILKTTFSDIDKVINVGIAGGIDPLRIGDIVIGKNTIYGDVNIPSSEEDTYGQMAECPRLFTGDEELVQICQQIGGHIATICTCDTFTTSKKDVDELISNHFQKLNVLAFDMESAAFSQAAYRFNIPFLAVRAISDVIGRENQNKDYELNFKKASKISNEYILKLIEKNFDEI